MTRPTPFAPLRTAIVGLGRIGFNFHLPAISRDARFELVGICDPLPERLAEAVPKTRAPGYRQLEDMLAATRPDLVVIASPTPFHAAQAEAAFAAGAHVFCEKPVAPTLAEFERMAAAGEGARRRLVPYQPLRYAPEVRALKELWQRDLLGHVHLIQRTRCNYERRRDWQAFRANGGGLLNNHGSHCLDEMLWLLDGEKIRSVYCQLRRAVSAGDAEDVVLAILTTETDRLIELHISQAAALSGPSWQLFGARGAARWTEADRQVEVRYVREQDAPVVIPETGWAAAGRQYRTESLPWQSLVEPTDARAPYDYYDALWRHLVQDQPPPVSVAEARELLLLLERCRRSAETGRCT